MYHFRVLVFRSNQCVGVEEKSRRYDIDDRRSFSTVRSVTYVVKKSWDLNITIIDTITRKDKTVVVDFVAGGGITIQDTGENLF